MDEEIKDLEKRLNKDQRKKYTEGLEDLDFNGLAAIPENKIALLKKILETESSQEKTKLVLKTEELADPDNTMNNITQSLRKYPGLLNDKTSSSIQNIIQVTNFKGRMLTQEGIDELLKMLNTRGDIGPNDYTLDIYDTKGGSKKSIRKSRNTRKTKKRRKISKRKSRILRRKSRKTRRKRKSRN
tara:strand:- start:59 stop:613 length:555 start_codon:yes stop_codon:yes gene_type:complete